jgi:ATP-dependent helicase HrpB
LGALDETARITEEGRALARLPLHPRLAHMVHRAGLENDALTASILSVLLTERGLGGTGLDLAHRVSNFWTERSKRADDARDLARRWAKMAGGEQNRESGDIGRHLARAYPDRVAQSAGARGRFRLVNGRAAIMDAAEPLAASPYLVVTDITGGAANGRIRAAAAIDKAIIEDLFADAIVDETVMAFDATSRSVRARRIRQLGAVRLSDDPTAINNPLQAAELLAAGIAETGIAALPWSADELALRARVGYLARVSGDTEWPDLSDEALAKGVSWLVPFILGRTTLSGVTPTDLGAALDALLPWDRRAEIERLLPSHFDAPSGSRVPIDYAAENGPAVSIRVQELFGLDRHPSVADGKAPLLLILLSPAHRPIQMTRDLPAFWRGSWKETVKDLKGRYPRHFWPDDPATAQATNRAKPRGA